MKSQPKIWLFLMLMALTTVKAGDALSAKVLDNGLRVIVVENHTVPLATINLVVRSGAFTETPEENGLTNLHAHMFFKANQAFPTREANQERIRELGMVIGGSSKEEWENFSITLSRDSLKAGLEFVQQSVMYPLFTGDELVLEKQVVLTEMDREAADPISHLDRALRTKLWGRNVSRKDYLGDRKIVMSATLDQMRLIQERYVIPNNSALLVAGDVGRREVFRLAENLFGDWKAAPDPFQTYPIPPMVPLTAGEDTIVVQPINNAEIIMAWHGPGVMEDVKGTFAADVLSFILNQKTSEFQKKLIDSGIALKADVVYYTFGHTGPIYVRLTCRPQKFREAYRAVQAEIEKFADPDYFTDEQLANAKTLLEVDAIYGQDKASVLVHHVAFWWAVAGLDYYRDYLENLRAVSREDIVNYVNRYIIDQPRITAAMVNRQTQRELGVVEGSLAK